MTTALVPSPETAAPAWEPCQSEAFEMRLPQLLTTACPAPGLTRTVEIAQVTTVLDLRGNPDPWKNDDITDEVEVAEFSPRRFDDLSVRMWEASFASDFYLLLWEGTDRHRYLLVLPNDDDLFTEYVVDASAERHEERHVANQSEDCEWWEMIYGDWLEEVTNAFPELLAHIIPALFDRSGLPSDPARIQTALRLVESTMVELVARLHAGEEVGVAEAIGLLGLSGSGHRPSEVPQSLLHRYGAISGWFLHQWATRSVPLDWLSGSLGSIGPIHEWDLLDTDARQSAGDGFVHWVAGDNPEVAHIEVTVLAAFFLDHIMDGYWPYWSAAEIRTVHDLGATSPTTAWKVMRAGYHRDTVVPDFDSTAVRTAFCDYVTQWLEVMPLEVAAWYIADGTPVEAAAPDYADGNFDAPALEMLWALGSPVPVPAGLEDNAPEREWAQAEGVRLRQQAATSEVAPIPEV